MDVVADLQIGLADALAIDKLPGCQQSMSAMEA
jgi:hypothetical protein